MVMSFIETAIEKRKGLRGVLSLSLPLSLFHPTTTAQHAHVSGRKDGEGVQGELSLNNRAIEHFKGF